VTRVVVLGAAGELGSEVVHRLVARRYEVTAFVRRPGSAQAAHVAEVVGDARDREAVRSALVGADAVVDALGGGTLRRNDLESTAMMHIVAGMHQLGIRRLMAMSAGMVVRTNPILDCVLKPTIFRHILTEHRRVEAIVMATDLDWTLVRPRRLVSRLPRGYNVSTGVRYSGSLSIPRSDVAEFIVDELAQAAFVRQAVYVSASSSGVK
jgi:putative NADH-flavin reductase